MHILKIQSRSKNLTAVKGKLKAQNPRSETAYNLGFSKPSTLIGMSYESKKNAHL